jgi:succinylglutamic semialdehyde dehydrogenase
MNFTFKGNYFNNAFQSPQTSGIDRTDVYLERECPARLDHKLWRYPIDYRHIDPAIESLQEGQIELQKLNLSQRIELLKSVQKNLESKKSIFAETLSLESGRPLWDTLEEVHYAIENFSAISKYSYDFFTQYKEKSAEKFHFKSSGPALIIGSSSDPFALPLEQISYLFLSGNSTLYKPSEYHLQSAQELFEVLHDSGLPMGSVNLLLGDREMSSRLLKTKDVKNIFFSGTTDHGLKVSELYGVHLKGQLNLQLSSKNSCIIGENANINFIIPNLLKSAYQAAGQFSNKTSLVFIHETVADEFIQKYHQRVKQIIIDHPTDFVDEPFMGSLISQNKCDNYIQYIGMAKREGAEEIMRGKRIETKYDGYYVSPSIHYYEEINSLGHFLKDELLLPNTTFIKYNSLDNVVSLINDLPYGLACSLFIDEDKQELANRLDIGIILQNSFLTPHRRDFRFGGDKNSSNFSNIGQAMFEAGLKRVSLQEHNTINNIKQLIGLKL